MPKAYSVDFREKILAAYLNKEGSIPELAERFKVSDSTVKRIGRRHRETGQVCLYLHHAGRHELIDAAGQETLKELIRQKADATLLELQESYYNQYGVKPVLSVFSRVLRKIKLNYKKKSPFAQQQETDEIKKKEKNL
jgi:transposase